MKINLYSCSQRGVEILGRLLFNGVRPFKQIYNKSRKKSNISITRDHLLPHFQTTWRKLKRQRAAGYLWRAFRCLENICKTLSQVFDTCSIWGSKVGPAVRELASHRCGLGSILTQCHMWVKFAVGSRLAPRVFSEFSSFPPQKPTLQIPIRPG